MQAAGNGSASAGRLVLPWQNLKLKLVLPWQNLKLKLVLPWQNLKLKLVCFSKRVNR
jgi:hypothetical protein